jgi:hypothetical protein
MSESSTRPPASEPSVPLADPPAPPASSSHNAAEEKKRVRAGCIISVVLLIIAVVLAILLIKPGEAPGEKRVAYFTQPVDIDTKTKVMFHGEEVGRVKEVKPNFEGFQFVVYDLKRWVRAIGTLPYDRHSWIRLHDVDITYNDSGTLSIKNAGWTIQIYRDGESHWRFGGVDKPSSFRLARYRKSIDSLQRDTANNTMRDGDMLLLGTAQLEWRNPMLFTRVEVKIDVEKVRELAGEAFNAKAFQHYIGPGSELALASNFGLSRPSLKLIPSIDTSRFDTIIVAQGEKRDTIVEREIIGNAGVDFEGFLAGGANYLMAPSRLGAPPRNNFERIVANAVTATDSLASASNRVNDIVGEANDYLNNPANLHTKPETRLQTAVNDINVALANIKVLEATIRSAVRSADNMIGNIDRTTRPEIESTLRTVRADLDLITIRIDQVSATLADTTLVQLDQTLVKATADIDQLTADIHRLSRTLNQLVQQVAVIPR